MATNRSPAVLEVSGVQWASSKNVAEAVLSRRPGVLQVDANPVSQTATVTYDPSQTSVAELAKWVRDCGYHCAGQSVPDHICDPLAEPPALLEKRDHHHTTQHTPVDHGAHHDHVTIESPGDQAAATATPEADHAGDAPERPESDHAAHAAMTPQEAMGHGGHHGAMSMDAMVRDMRNRFIVAAVLSVPILLWSPIGREVFGYTVPAPFGKLPLSANETCQLDRQVVPPSLKGLERRKIGRQSRHHELMNFFGASLLIQTVTAK